MRKLMNSRALLPVRGGHGWARPDPPLTEDYIHKRENSIFDSNIWFYDDTAPEYALTYTEMHVRDHFGVLKEWFYNFPYLFGCFLFVAGFYTFGQNTVLDSNDSGDELLSSMRDVVNITKERKGLQRNILGLELTSQNGTYHADYDKKFQLIKLAEEKLARIQEIKQINFEAKSFVERVEKEVREKYSH